MRAHYKSLFFSVLISGLLFMPTMAQTLQPDDATRTLRWVSPSLVEVTITSHEITQKGFYLLRNQSIVRHGTWTLWTNGEKTMAASYDKGELEWLQHPNGKQYTAADIKQQRGQEPAPFLIVD
jgi:hypothetical protein